MNVPTLVNVIVFCSLEKCYEVFYPDCIVNNPQIIVTSL